MTDHKLRPIVPKEFSGKWIAWNTDSTRIIAAGESLADVVTAAAEAGESDPCFEKVPPADVRLVGVTQ